MTTKQEDQIIDAFWWERLVDHLDFFLLKFAPEEKTWISRTKKLRVVGANLLNNILDGEAVSTDGKRLDDIITLKSEILALKTIPGGIELNLPPTFISHMLNEAKEYKRDLEFGPRDKSDIMLHYLWLIDGEGHALALYSELDPIDQHRQLVKKRIKALKHLAKKAAELKDYNKHIDLNDGVMAGLIKEASLVINDFRELMEDMQKADLLGTLSPLMLDHMIREEFYYLYRMGAENVQPSDFIRNWAA